MELAAGTIVERYRVEARIGEGGMARVYRVRHTELGGQHALKVLTLQSGSVRARLLQEGRAQNSLRHTNVVPVTDVIDVGGAPGLVMELVGGPSLDQLLRWHHLDLDQADALAIGILRGVAAAHAAGFVHRDLKPANVLIALTEDGLVPRITDFGLAKVLGAHPEGATRTGEVFGTPSYMAPEQIHDAKSVDERADVFSLGALLFELVTGRRCFEGRSAMAIFEAILAGRHPDIRELVPSSPSRMEAAIRGALEVDRERRLASCRELLAVWTEDGAETEAELLPVDDLWGDALISDLATRTRAAREASPTAVPVSEAPLERTEWGKRGYLPMWSRGTMVAGAVVLALVGGLQFAQWWLDIEPPAPDVPIVSRQIQIQGRFEDSVERFLAADLQGAARGFEAVLEDDGSASYAWYMLALAHLLQGERAFARTELEEAATLLALDGGVHAELARLHRDALDAPVDPIAWEELVSRAPDDPVLRIAAALAASDPDSALRHTHAAIATRPDALLAYLLEVRLAHEAERWAVASATLGEALRSHPGDPEALYLLGRHHFLQQRWDQAEEALLLALDHAPAHPQARFLLACAVDLQGDSARRDELLDLVFSDATPVFDRIRLSRADAWYAFGTGRLAQAREQVTSCSALAKFEEISSAFWDCGRAEEKIEFFLIDQPGLEHPVLPSGQTRRCSDAWVRGERARAEGELDEARVAYTGVVDGTQGCKGAFADRYLEARSRVALARIALELGDLDVASTQLEAFRALWPEADADHPLVLEAVQVAVAVEVGRSELP